MVEVVEVDTVVRETLDIVVLVEEIQEVVDDEVSDDTVVVDTVE